jgi:hypothetical protein
MKMTEQEYSEIVSCWKCEKRNRVSYQPGVAGEHYCGACGSVIRLTEWRKQAEAHVPLGPNQWCQFLMFMGLVFGGRMNWIMMWIARRYRAVIYHCFIDRDPWISWSDPDLPSNEWSAVEDAIRAAKVYAKERNARITVAKHVSLAKMPIWCAAWAQRQSRFYCWVSPDGRVTPWEEDVWMRMARRNAR